MIKISLPFFAPYEEIDSFCKKNHFKSNHFLSKNCFTLTYINITGIDYFLPGLEFEESTYL